MKRLFNAFLLLLLLFSTEGSAQGGKKDSTPHSQAEISAIDDLLNRWHKAAGQANFEAYFSLMAEDAVFIGTDPTENWSKAEFKKWAQPYFDRGAAWDFSTLERNIFPAENCKIAWFDELLETQMGICRGSGVVVKENGSWKIKHYVLSIAVPNQHVDELTNLKKEFDQSLISKIKSK